MLCLPRLQVQLHCNHRCFHFTVPRNQAACISHHWCVWSDLQKQHWNYCRISQALSQAAEQPSYFELLLDLICSDRTNPGHQLIHSKKTPPRTDFQNISKYFHVHKCSVVTRSCLQKHSTTSCDKFSFFLLKILKIRTVCSDSNWSKMNHLFVKCGISLITKKSFVTNKYSGLFMKQPKKTVFKYEKQKSGFHIEHLPKERTE